MLILQDIVAPFPLSHDQYRTRRSKLGQSVLKQLGMKGYEYTATATARHRHVHVHVHTLTRVQTRLCTRTRTSYDICMGFRTNNR